MFMCIIPAAACACKGDMAMKPPHSQGRHRMRP
nr:MAG TPA: hypothetical protein [Caudoviricetes sp.]